VAEAAALAEQLPRHAYVINLHSDRYRYLRAFCAAVIAGQCTLMPPNRLAHTLSQLAETYPDSYVIGEDGDEPPISGVAGSAIPAIDPEQLCAIAFTSGSTGVPKPNKKYWRTLEEGAKGNARLLLGSDIGELNMVATVPAQHMWGMEMSIMLPLFAPVAISDKTPFFPQDIADAINELPAPVALVSSPIHLEALLRSGVKPNRLDRIFTATAPLSRKLAINLETTFAARVQDVFGCSESGILATRNPSTEDLWNYADFFDLDATQEGIRIRANHLPEDVLMPDIVELVGDRQYRWLGRHADMVNIAGKRGSLADINNRLRELDGVVDGVIFARDEQAEHLAGLVVAPGMDVSDILRQLKNRIEPVFLPRPIYKVDMLPRQETGKIAVKAVMDMFNQIRASKAN